MADVFDEISDDLRREKLNTFWNENKNWIIGGAVGAVLLTGILSFWRHYEFQRNLAATAELTKLVNAADLPKLESFADDTSKNHAAVGRMMAASVHLKRNQTKEAIALYDKVADTTGLDHTWRDLAKIYSISLQLDTAKPEQLAEDLEDLTGDKDVWRYSARELAAMVEARRGNIDKAADILMKISADPMAPPDARARAFTLRSVYVAGKPEPKS